MLRRRATIIYMPAERHLSSTCQKRVPTVYRKWKTVVVTRSWDNASETIRSEVSSYPYTLGPSAALLELWSSCFEFVALRFQHKIHWKIAPSSSLPEVSL
ncbi:hypothetical protein PsYK624_035200 [Phanerochaete sordida]|uniref:Uncharacterized protein n=1 Tax=Phanerochaete sordida TaxID=48140 RepID=A0A9P3G3I6_9APHY|nr:hypothetical protein PsYK624_035200 [Phanerochaete sordida]